MNVLIKTCIKLNAFGLVVIVISAIAVYGFGQGDQKFLGMHMLSILVIATYALLAIAVLENLIFKPAAENHTGKLTKQLISLDAERSFTAGEASYMNDVIDEITKIGKNSHRFPVLAAFFFYFGLGPILGSPFVEWATIAIMWIGPLALIGLAQGAANQTRALNPELYAATSSLLKTMDDTQFEKA